MRPVVEKWARLAVQVGVLSVFAGGVADAAADEAPLSQCPAAAHRSWEGVGTVDAAAIGPSCAQSALVLTIRDQNGVLLYVDATEPSHLFGFDDAATPPKMQAALEEWLDAESPSFDSTGDLPAWTADNAGALGGDFPFYPEIWVDEHTYTRLRGADQPMFCYVQGQESMACVAFFPELGEAGLYMRFGVQTFPG